MPRSLYSCLITCATLLLLFSFATVEVHAQINATATLGVGQTHNGTLRSSDPAIDSGNHVQCFNLNLQANQEVIVTLRSHDFDTTLFAGNGRCGSVNLTMENDDFESGSTDSQLRFVPTQRDYVVAVSSYGGGETGNFTLSVTSGSSAPPPSPSASEPVFMVGTLGNGQQYTGNLTSNSLTIDNGQHVQCVELNLQANRQATVTLRSRQFDTNLFIGPGRCAGDGFDLEYENDDFENSSTDSQVRFTPNQSQYVAMITSYSSGETGNYTLTIE